MMKEQERIDRAHWRRASAFRASLDLGRAPGIKVPGPGAAGL